MSEAQEARRDGAKLQKNSGRGPIQKGDATLGDFLIDYKESAKSFTLSLGILAKLNKDAIGAGNKIGVLKVILGEDVHKQRVWVVPEYLLLDYIALKGAEDE